MLIASLALAALLGVASARVQSAEGELFTTFRGGEDHRISELIGATVYVTEAEIPMTEVDTEPEDWEAVARVDDFVMTGDGQIRGVLIDVGGFFGLGARTVAVDIDDVEVLYNAERDECRVYLSLTEEELENLPEYRP